MPPSLKPAIIRSAKKLRSEGLSYLQIAERLGIGKATVCKYLQDQPIKPAKGERSEVIEPAEELPEPSAPSADLPPLTMAELRGWVSSHMRGLQAEVLRCERSKDAAGATAARRLLTAAAPLAARITPEDKTADGEIVEVRRADLDADGQRAVSKLIESVERAKAEIAKWPRCSVCGQPVEPAKETEHG